MTISTILYQLDEKVRKWLDGSSNLLEIDNLLHLRAGTIYGLLYTLGLSSIDGIPQSGVTAEHVLNSIMFAILLKHHLSLYQSENI